MEKLLKYLIVELRVISTILIGMDDYTGGGKPWIMRENYKLDLERELQDE